MDRFLSQLHNTDGRVKIIARKMANPKIGCWWQGRNDVVLVQFSVFYNERDGTWSKLVKNGKQPINGWPYAESIPEFCVPVFGYRLHGPPDVTKSPQELAQLWQHQFGGVLAACDFRPDFLDAKRGLQAFCVLPQWSFVLSVPQPLRCFYETVPDSRVVGFF